MTTSVKILLLCGLCVFHLAKVDGRHSKTRRSDEAETEKNMSEERGILSHIFGENSPSYNQPIQQQQPINIPAPPFLPDQALAPVFQIPHDVVPGQSVTQHKPSLFGGLLNILNSRELSESEENNKQASDGRGIISDVLGVLRPPSNTIQNVPVNIPAPSFYPEQALAPTFQVPTNVAGQTIVQNRPPSILGGLMSIFGSGENQPVSEYNRNWLNYALQKCARVDPKSLTAILPTTTNGLRTPKMYYFQNETSGVQTWYQAQQWCTQRGMSLLTVNDANENKVIVDRLRQIMAGSTVGTITGTIIDPNPTAWWIGLNGLTPGGVPTWVGDGTSTFTDWHTGVAPVEPNPSTAIWCGTYNQVTTIDNIRMDARDCTTAPGTRLRFICEVSDECTALFMSRFPTSYFHHPNNAHGHIHYSPGGVLPPVGTGGK